MIFGEYVTRKSTSTGSEKKLSTSASSRGSTRSRYGPGSRRAITKPPFSLSEKLATNAPVSGLKATTWAPRKPWPFLVTRPVMLPVCSTWPAAG